MGARRSENARRGLGGDRLVERSASGSDELAVALGGPLLRWYAAHRRDLPWRTAPHPYSVWVSEMMLQQTRVEVAIPYYERFLRRFPTLSSLAQAPVEEVLALWSGLGYYRRARALHEGARLVLRKHGGEFPRDFAAALEIPGIGPYTAGAILSIAYNLPVPVVDGNVERVLSRLLRLAGNPKSAALAARLLALARASIPSGRASDFNQALMELGATVCKPKSPRCGDCPLAGLCLARRSGNPEEFPGGPSARPTVAVQMDALVARRRGRLLLERRKPGELLEGLWLFPLLERGGGSGTSASRETRAYARSILGSTREPRFVGEVRHSITFRRIRVRVFALDVRGDAAAPKREPRDASERVWARPEDLGTRIPVPSLALKIAGLLGASPAPDGVIRGS